MEFNSGFKGLISDKLGCTSVPVFLCLAVMVHMLWPSNWEPRKIMLNRRHIFF